MLMVALGTGIAPMRAFIEAPLPAPFFWDVGIFDPSFKLDGHMTYREQDDQKHDNKNNW